MGRARSGEHVSLWWYIAEPNVEWIQERLRQFGYSDVEIDTAPFEEADGSITIHTFLVMP